MKKLASAGAVLVLALSSFPACAKVYGPEITPPSREEQYEAIKQLEAESHSAWKKFWLLQGLSAADAVTTCVAVGRGATELNPLYFSKHPSCERVVAIKAGFGLLQYLLLKNGIERDPRKASRGLNVVIAIQGVVVASNLVQLAK